MKLRTKLQQLRRAAPKGPNKNGQLYARKEEIKGAYKRITLHTLFISEENTHIHRPHVFAKDRALTPQQWHAWLSANLEHIHRSAILPGLAVRTNKSWAVERIMGWVADAKHKARPTSLGRKRHKTKRQRRKNG